jgi:HEPN domain-containing protein
VNRQEYKSIAEMRLDDAQILVANRRYAGAYYIAGYAIECGLKACIAKQYRRYEYPPRDAQKLYTHNLAELATNSRLAGLLDTQKKSVPGFGPNWSVVSIWSEQSRYEQKPLLYSLL